MRKKLISIYQSGQEPGTFKIDVIISGGVAPYNVYLDYGDGTNTSGSTSTGDISFTHTYDLPGSYTVAADVTDSSGQTASGTGTVSVATPTGTLSLGVSPSAGNSLTYFTFAGTLKDNSGTPLVGKQVIIYYKGQPYSDELAIATTDSNGNYSAIVSGFQDGSYSVYAAYVLGYGAGGSSNPIIGFESSAQTFTVSAGKLTCAGGIYSVIAEPDGSHYVYGMSGTVTGGSLPYDFKFYWSDGKVDDGGATAVDDRYFAPGVSYATPTKCVVTSADGQTCSETLTYQA